jgi:hypothetical protein
LVRLRGFANITVLDGAPIAWFVAAVFDLLPQRKRRRLAVSPASPRQIDPYPLMNGGMQPCCGYQMEERRDRSTNAEKKNDGSIVDQGP